jgi:putative ABC transport system permease protein
MNIVNKVTLEHLKKNKRRTLVTILGVIISVAMITAVSTISGSFMDMLQRHTVAETGDWHVRYEGITSDKLTAIRQDSNTKHITVSKDKGYAKLEGSRHSQRPYLYVTQYDTEGMQSLPVTIIQGRYPRNDNEIAISEQTIRTSGVNYEVGDVIALDLGCRVSDIGHDLRHYLGQEDALVDNEYFVTTETKQYTVTGIIDAFRIDRNWHPGYWAISGLDVNKLSPTEKCTVTVGLKSVDQHIYENATNLAEQVNASKVGYNTRLLMFYGVTDDGHLRDTFVIATAIVGVIILIGSVSLIYNAFAISLSERSRYLGMLSSIGATKQQKRNSVLFEGFVVGIVAIPIGVLCGTLGIGITFTCVNPIVQNVFGVTEPLELVLLPSALCGAVLFSILMIAISAWVPARRASRIAPIDAIRQSQDIAIKSGDVKTSRLTRTVFGFEAELGLKNLKRNKYRYRATLFSLTISVVLFLVSSAFTFYMKKSFDMTQTELNFDVVVFVQARGDEPYEQYLVPTTANTAVTATKTLLQGRINLNAKFICKVLYSKNIMQKLIGSPYAKALIP